MSKRGVLYMVWGEKPKGVLERAIASLHEHHPDMPVEVVGLPDDTDPIRGLLEKARMQALSPFDSTLFLDADTVVLGRLDFGFEKGERFGLACCICECPWARRYGGISGELIEYNTGVMFFTDHAKPLFEAWERQVATVDSSLRFNMGDGERLMPFNDQAGFAAAVEETGANPFILPLNWNFRPAFQSTFFGPVRIWHDYQEVPDTLRRMNAAYTANPDATIDFVRMSVRQET